MTPERTASSAALRPLADRMRPRNLDEFVGQAHLLARGKPLRQALEGGRLHSMVLWGPPGTGKTTLARLIAGRADAQFLALSAVMAGVKDIRAAVEKARQERQSSGRPTVLFLDEVHRFNKAQQDTFLPFLEDGTLTFIGATTENPSFEVVSALLSRARVYVLKALGVEDLVGVAERGTQRQRAGAGSRGAARLARGAGADRAGRGRGRAPRPQHAGTGGRAGRGARRRTHPGHRPGGRKRRPAPVRQGRGPVLRPDLGAAQSGPRHGS